MRLLAPFAGLLGGLAWLGALVLERSSRTGLAEVAEWVGLALLLGACFGGGAALVSRSTTWLRILVGLCAAVLAWSLVQVFDAGGEDRVVQAALGVVAIVIASLAMARSRPEAPPDSGGGSGTGPGAGRGHGRRTRGAHVR